MVAIVIGEADYIEGQIIVICLPSITGGEYKLVLATHYYFPIIATLYGQASIRFVGNWVISC